MSNLISQNIYSFAEVLESQQKPILFFIHDDVEVVISYVSPPCDSDAWANSKWKYCRTDGEGRNIFKLYSNDYNSLVDIKPCEDFPHEKLYIATPKI